MRWLVIYLLLIAVIWLFVTNRMWRRSLLAFSTIVFGVFMLLFTLSQRDTNEEIKTADRFNEVRRQESVTFGAVKTTDIGIGETSLTNPVRTVFDSAGGNGPNPICSDGNCRHRSPTARRSSRSPA